MAHVQADRVKDTTTTTGTGNVTLSGTAPTGYRNFASVMANNDTCFYCIADETNGAWEVGLGTYVSATPALARTTVIRSSNSDAAVNLASGTKTVFITSLAERSGYLAELSGAPETPASGITLFTSPKAGRRVPRFVGPSGIESPVQPTLWANSVTMWLPGAGTTASIGFGITWTVSATQAHPAIADTNVMTKIKRATYTTTTTAGNAAGVRSVQPVATRNAGFFFAARWGILTYTSTMQAWCGLGAASGIIAGDPSAANNSCGMSKDTGETTWQVFTRDGSTTSKTSTGRTTAAGGAAEVFDVFMFCKPGDSKITFRVEDIASANVPLADTEKSSNLPGGTTALYAHCETRNVAGGAGSAVAVFLGKMYIECDL